MKTKINSLCKSKYLVMYAVVLITFLSSCAITRLTPNIKSVDDLKGHKLLVGRFVFYVNGNQLTYRNKELGHIGLGHIGKYNMGPVFQKEGEKQRRVFAPNDDGYVYIAVTDGQYNLELGSTMNARFNIYDTDQVVNFGTIKYETSDYEASKVPIAVNVVTSIIAGVTFGKAKGSWLVTQIPEWNDTRNYVLSQLNIPPQLIRDERIPDLLNGLKID